MTEPLLQDASEAFVGVRNGKGSLIKIIDVDFYVFYMLINLLQFIVHLVDVVAEHLVVFVLAQLVSILPELLISSRRRSCLLHLRPDKLFGLRTEGRHDILIGVLICSIFLFGAIKQIVLCLLAHVVKADFAEAAVHRHLVSILELFDALVLSPAGLRFERVGLLGHNLIGESSTSDARLIVHLRIEAHEILALFDRLVFALEHLLLNFLPFSFQESLLRLV